LHGRRGSTYILGRKEKKVISYYKKGEALDTNKGSKGVEGHIFLKNRSREGGEK